MNKGISKWPSRALNLLVILAMVISLTAIFVAPPIAVGAQACPRAIEYTGCHLSVAVSTYIKTAEGDFTPQRSFNPPVAPELVGECFYVNAVVVNDGDATAPADINATITLPAGVTLAVGEEDYPGDVSIKTWPGSQGITVLETDRMADFWWKVCCSGATGNVTIKVDATAGPVGEPPVCVGSGSTWVVQEVTGPEQCLEIKIVEAPGLGLQTGRLLDGQGQPIVYDSTGMPTTIEPCQNFGIKAEVTNLCDEPIAFDSNADICIAGYEIDPATGLHYHPALDGRLFSIVGLDPECWDIDSLNPGETTVVGWTLHCEGPGDGNVSVWAPAYERISTHVNNPVLVHQAIPGGLDIEIIKPVQTKDCLGGNVTIKQATNCYNTFEVRATVTYRGLGIAQWVYAEIGASSLVTPWVQLPDPSTILIGNLSSFETKEISFGYVTCKGTGIGNITATARSLQPVDPPAPDTDIVAISQQSIIGDQAPYYVSPGTVNVCDPAGFKVIFRYYNWSGFQWQKPADGNVTTCVMWTGDGTAELTGVKWAKVSNPTVPTRPADTSWHTMSASGGAGQACIVLDDVICPCCAFDVEWSFKCTGPGDVTFYGNTSVNAIGFTGYEETGPVCVKQEYKAELYSDILFFLQDDQGIMVEQDAMMPGNDFHVVMPVMNTGDADALNVQLFFRIANAGAGCAVRYDYISGSGDAVVSFNENTGTGTATFSRIYGHSTQKAVLLMHCLCEGNVSVEIPKDMEGVPGWTNGIPGLKGTDENTLQPIPPTYVGDHVDIHVPPCPLIFQQIPFTVTLENPETCQNFNTGDIFTVKALICNGSDTQDFNDVSAELFVENERGVSILGSTVVLVSPQQNPKDVGNITDGSCSEITWVVQCNGGGEAFIHVVATSDTPMLRAVSDVVNVHQHEIPAPVIDVVILSPHDTFGDNDTEFADIDSTHVATGEPFAVTAVAYNYGTTVAEDVMIGIGTNQFNFLNDCIWTALGVGDGVTTKFYLYPPQCVTPGSIAAIWVGDDVANPQSYTITYGLMSPGGLYTMIEFSAPPAQGDQIWTQYLGSFTLLEGEMNAPLGDIQPGGYVEYTWTLQGTNNCWPQCMTWPFNIDVAAWTTSGQYTEGCDEVDVVLYPAAHLVVEIGQITPSIAIPTCSEFVVPYTVTNIGQADAWNVSVTLSADPAGSVRLAAGEQGYTQKLGTIAGWKVDGTHNSESGTFVMHCKQVCESTITITPMGYDECGYSPLNVRHDYEWEGLPGSVIQSKFLEPASITVKQLDSGQLDLAITKTVDNAFPAAGGAVNFTITVTNNGPTAASGVKVHDTQPAGLTFGAATASQGAFAGGVWTVGNLVVGGSATLVIPATVASASQITNTATIKDTDCDQPDPYTDNNKASVTLNKPAVTAASFTLRAGWNLISLPLIPDAAYDTPSELLGGVMNSIAQIRTFESCVGTAGTWYAYIRNGPNTLSTMKDGNAYWVKMDSGFATTAINFTGYEQPEPPVLPRKYTVCVGWNMQGFKEVAAMPAGAYLGNVNYVRIWSFANGAYSPVTSVDDMLPGLGYWIAVPSVVAGVSDTIYP